MPISLNKSDFINTFSKILPKTNPNKVEKYAAQEKRISGAQKVGEMAGDVFCKSACVTGASFMFYPFGLVVLPVTASVCLVSGLTFLSAALAHKTFKSCYGAPFNTKTPFNNSWLQDEKRLRTNIEKGWIDAEEAKILTDFQKQYLTNMGDFCKKASTIKPEITDLKTFKINTLIDEIRVLEIKMASGNRYGMLMRDQGRLKRRYQNLKDLNEQTASELMQESKIYRTQIGELSNKYYEHIAKNSKVNQKNKEIHFPKFDGEKFIYPQSQNDGCCCPFED